MRVLFCLGYQVKLNIEKLDGNIVQKHGGSKQVGIKQLGPGVETGVHRVYDEKRVWFEVELQGAQGDREAEVFQVSNDDTAVAQRRLEDKQPEEKTNTDCLRSTQQYMKSGVAKHFGVGRLQQQNGLVKETNVTLLAKNGDLMQQRSTEAAGALLQLQAVLLIFFAVWLVHRRRVVRLCYCCMNGGAVQIRSITARVLNDLSALKKGKRFLEVIELKRRTRESQFIHEFKHAVKSKEKPFTDTYVRGLKESNFDQLYAYLKQHEVHANENRTMMERFLQPTNDHLALVSNASVQQYPQQIIQVSSSSNDPSPADELFNWTQGSSRYSWKIQCEKSKADHFRETMQRNVVAGEWHITREIPRPKRLPDSDYFKVQDATKCKPRRMVQYWTKKQSLFLQKQIPIYIDVGPITYSNTPFGVQDHDTFVVRWMKYLKYIEMHNDVQHNNVGVQSRLANKPDKVVNDSFTSELARYKELVGEYEKRAKFELTDRERKIDEQMNKVELEKVKQHYKELYDSIKITRVHTREKTSTMLNEIESLKAQLKSKVSCVTIDSIKPKVLAPGIYAIDVKPIPYPLKNNRSAHLTYINHLRESVETVREIVEEARVAKPLDNALNYACQYTKLSQELLEYMISTCPKSFNERDNKAPSTPVTRKKQVTFNDKPGTSSSNTQKHKVHQKVQQTNVPCDFISIGAIPSLNKRSSLKQ
ncbi:hypothetical protein Tco_0096613 [Tanacetum coccineum]